MSRWFLILVVSCLACSVSSTAPDPMALTDESYRATALVNDSTWYSAARASRSVSLTSGTLCTAGRVDISFITDLPYTSTAPTKALTGCLSECVPTQQLVFYRVPIGLGKYDLADLTACAPAQGAIVYTLLRGGDAVVNTFSAQPNHTGWLQITAYNEGQNLLEGTFEVELVDQTAKTVRFKRGAFKAVLK